MKQAFSPDAASNRPGDGLLAALPLDGSRRALQSNRNDVKDWLPDEFPETATTPGSRAFPARAVRPGQLGGLHAGRPAAGDAGARSWCRRRTPRAGSGEPAVFQERCLTGRAWSTTCGRYTDPSSTEEEVLQRLEGSLIGKDHHKTCLVVTLSDEATGKAFAAIETDSRAGPGVGHRAEGRNAARATASPWP